MNQSPNQRIALVTGVGRAGGLGYELCRQLATQSITVLLTARKQPEAESLASALTKEGFDVRPFVLDITKAERVQAMADAVETEFGRLDILVNNAAAWST